MAAGQEKQRHGLAACSHPAGVAAGDGLTDAGNEREEGATPAQRMTWAQRLRRVFRKGVVRPHAAPG